MPPRGAPIDYRVRGYVAEIPKPTELTPYSKITTALARAPKDKRVVHLTADDEAGAIALSKRLHAFFTGQGVSVRRLPGTNHVFVQPRPAAKPKASPKRKKRHR